MQHSRNKEKCKEKGECRFVSHQKSPQDGVNTCGIVGVQFGSLANCKLRYFAAELTVEGTISWMNFDEVSIPNDTTSPNFWLWKMPPKTNYTGIIGLVSETDQSQGYKTQVFFSANTNALPSGFQANRNNVAPAFGNVQVPAPNGNGSDEW